MTKKKSKGGDAIVASLEDKHTYTLPNLVKKLGPATKAEVDDYVGGLNKDELTYEGSRVATERIDTDAARLYGRAAAFLKTASEEQLDALMGVSLDHVRVGAWAALQGSEAFESLQKTKRTSGSAKEQLGIAAEKARALAMTRRRALRTGLLALAAGDSALVARIEHANGTAKEPKSLSDALSALAEIGESLLVHKNPSVAARAKNARLSKKMLDSDRALAATARDAGEQAQGVMSEDAMTQSKVDMWDGINLFLLGTLIRVFETGHAQDPGIPRLVPITLHSYYSRKSAPAKATSEDKGEKGGKKSAGSGKKAGSVPDKGTSDATPS